MDRITVSVEVPTGFRSMGLRAQQLLQRVVDVVGEEQLPRVIAYVERDPARFEQLLREILQWV